MNTRKFLLTGITLSVLVGLTACGGASDSTTVATKGNPTTTTGPITAFGRTAGNTIVNGIEFNTASANVVVEGKTNATQADLKVGMMVTIKASDTTATSISSKDEVEGVVTDPIPGGATTGDLTVMGQTVTIDDKTIFYSYVDAITDAGMITTGNVIEVSGYSTGKGTITATRLEVKALVWDASMELEVSGTVAKNDAAAKTFEIGNLVVLYTNAMLKDIPNDTIADGMHVEVKSTEGLNADNQLVASKVELESNDSATEGDYEVKGLIATITPDESITVGEDTFILDQNTVYAPVDKTLYVEGVLVEVEGILNADKKLVATKVELEDDSSSPGPGISKAKFKDTVASVVATGPNAGTLTLSDGTVVNVDNTTIMKDESAVADPKFNLKAVNVDDYLEIKAIDNNGVFTATKIVRKDAPTLPGMIKVEFKDTVASVTPTAPDAGTLTLADGTVITVVSKTFMVDKSAVADQNFNLEAVLVDDYLEITAIDNAGVITALSIVRKDVPPTTGPGIIKVEYKDTVASVTPTAPKVGTLTLADATVVNVDVNTIMIDRSSVADQNFNLEAVLVDDYLEIKAIDNAGVITALSIVRKDTPLGPGMTPVEFKDTVKTVTPTGPNVGTVTLADGTVVNVNVKTKMKDLSFVPDPAFNLESVLVDDYLEIKAIDNAGVITALSIERKDTPPGPGIIVVNFKDTVTTVTPTGPNVGTLTLADGTVVNVDVKTKMKDLSSVLDTAFNLESVLVNDYLEITAIDNAGVITALTIVRKDVPPVAPGTGIPAM